ncbi:hypothetical protein DFQ01_11892 [Paenibacillus cellulosilyticus]|uniref:Uncharacterized protein n=1 Tax=Paenibacillus cellulosilyticus TaxID=375489 RepID=A0A2V2YSA6_9BACL|nr:hypothetical protein DFQ01_11892 [Paenibacillus cellulosilyticus]
MTERRRYTELLQVSNGLNYGNDKPQAMVDRLGLFLSDKTLQFRLEHFTI